MTHPNNPTSPNHSLPRQIAAIVTVGAAALGGGHAVQHELGLGDDTPTPNVAALVATPIIAPGLEISIPNPHSQPTTSAKHSVTRRQLEPFIAKKLGPASKPKRRQAPSEFNSGGLILPNSRLLIPLPETPINNTTELKDLHPEKLVVPAEVSSYMQANVTYNYATRCSGFLIRDQQTGQPIGEQTAQHCGLLAKDNHQSTGPDGQPQFNFNGPFTVATGDRLDNTMVSVGRINRLLVSALDDTSKDIVYGAFGDNDPAIVAANANLASGEELAALKKGDVIYASGWPVDQPQATDSVLQRQEFAMHVLGDVTWELQTGQRLNIKLAAVPKSASDTECSPGMSGSEAFIYSADGQTRNLGVLSGYTDFGLVYNQDPARAQAERQNIQTLFGVDMEGYAAVCAIAYTPPSIEQGAYVADVVDTSSTSEPLPELPPKNPNVQADLELAQHEFDDPTYRKQILDGTVNIFSGKDGIDLYIHRPLAFYNPADNSVVIGYSNLDNNGRLIMAFYDNPSLVALYADRTDGTIPVQESIGQTTFGADTTGDDYGSYSDSNGFMFGQQLLASPLKLGPRFDLLIGKTGILSTQPAPIAPVPAGPKG